ncbi:Gfo/Idh/MocA family oxidoreductase [Aliiroseovarius sp.]|uniref:Gfo/Idh/MocA family protein n=1 Tax=Aliiroseovarius sp. TaxID=1872442 RepID=UPI00262E33FF|nr:Gfo/Idh/MocA family oxidoreductase [Aliiroseovarius sp.]
MTNLLGIAVVGLGAAARRIHLPAIAKTPGLRIVGGVDPVADASAFKFPVYRDFSRLLAECQPDVVAIVTPPDSHGRIAMDALKAGAHVFCEKPFVLSMEEGHEVIKVARAVDRHVVVNNEFRFMNVHEAAQKAIGSERFGDLLFVSMHQTFFVTEETEKGWRGESKQRTCFEFGTHALDLCRFFFGEEPHAISARMPKPNNPEGADYLNLIQLEFSGDRVAHITLDRLSRGPHRYLDIRLDGSNACIETHIGGKAEASFGLRSGSKKPFARLDLAASASADLYQGERRSRIATDPLDLFANSTANLLRAMLQSIRDGEKPPCSAEDNLNTLALMLSAYQSSEAGGAFLKLTDQSV